MGMMATMNVPRRRLIADGVSDIPIVPAVGSNVEPIDETDLQALAQLFRDEYRQLVRLAVLLVDRQDVAEELVQEAFVRLHRSGLDGVDNAPAYLRRTVANLARSKLRRRMVKRRHPEARLPDPETPDAMALLREDQRAVVEALRGLPPRQRQVLVLRYYGELSEREIAEALGLSVGGVKSNVHRATQSMRKRLGGRA